MVRPKKNRGRSLTKDKKWLSTSLTETVNTLTTTVTALGLDSSCFMTTSEDTDFGNDGNSSGEEPTVTDAETPNPNTISTNVTETDDEFESEEPPVNVTATVEQQVQMHFGKNNSIVSDEDESIVKLSPVDCATLDVLKLCHDGGCSLECFDRLFALLRKHSSKNGVDVTKLPKRDTFLKNLRARISSPMPIISQVGNLQVPHFDFLSQIRDLLGSFVFNDLQNLCVNLDPEDRFNVFTASDDDKLVEVCAQKWYKETYAEFVTDPQKQFLLPLIFYIDETGTDVFQRYPLEPLMNDQKLIERINTDLPGTYWEISEKLFPGKFWGGMAPRFSSSSLNFKEVFVDNQFNFPVAVRELKELLKLVNTSLDKGLVTAQIQYMAGSATLPGLNVFRLQLFIPLAALCGCLLYTSPSPRD